MIGQFFLDVEVIQLKFGPRGHESGIEAHLFSDLHQFQDYTKLKKVTKFFRQIFFSNYTFATRMHRLNVLSNLETFAPILKFK